MSKKAKKANDKRGIKDYLIGPWDAVLIPKMSNDKLLLLVVVGVIAVFGYLTQQYVEELKDFYSYICYYLAGWMFVLLLHSYIIGKDKALKKKEGFVTLKELWQNRKNKEGKPSVLSCIFMLIAGAVSILPIVFLYIIELGVFILVKGKIIHFSKNFIVILVALLVSLYLFYPLTSGMIKIDEAFPGVINENNAENIVVFFGLVITYFVTKFFIYIYTKLLDSEYKITPGYKRERYIENIYTETKFVYSVLLVLANILFKIFVIFQDKEKYINAFFVSSAIITLLSTCIATWKKIEKDDPDKYML